MLPFFSSRRRNSRMLLRSLVVGGTVLGLLLATQNWRATANLTYTAVDEFKQPRFTLNSRNIFQDTQLPAGAVSFNDQKLLRVLVNTREYYQKFQAEDPVVSRDGILTLEGVGVPQVLSTLDFMIATLRTDLEQNRPSRLRDPNFINQNFQVIRWSPFNPRNPQQQDLRITKYAVFTHPGSRQRTATFNVPLYALPANADSDFFYKKFTKQQVLAGIYEPGGSQAGRVKPLVYMTREAFEEALMQGTILINLTDGTSAYFNVDRNNGIAYVKGLAAESQKRYWYFRQVEAIKGYGNKIENKISIEPGVTFAGDVFNIGLGRVVALEQTVQGRRQFILGVIADTGGAFLPNLYQLDYLAGIFKDRQEFNQGIRNLPEFARTYILVKK